MVLAVEVFRPDKDPHFGLNRGWSLHCNGGQWALPREPFPSSQQQQIKLVFDEDQYETQFTLPTQPDPKARGGVWVTCEDSKTRIHLDYQLQVKTPSSSSPQKRKRLAATSRNRAQQQQQQQLLSTPHYKQVIFLSFPTLQVQVFSSPQTLEGYHFELQVQIGNETKTVRHSTSETKVRVVSPAKDFTIQRPQTADGKLGLSLMRVTAAAATTTAADGNEQQQQHESMSRVVQLDENGPGYLQGVRIGDVLIKENTLTFRRMEVLEITLPSSSSSSEQQQPQQLRFDFPSREQECWATLQLSMVHDSISTVFRDLEPLEQSFQMNKNKRNVLGTCKVLVHSPLNRNHNNTEQQASQYLSVQNFAKEISTVPVPRSEVCMQRFSFETRNRVFVSLVNQERNGDGSKFDLALVSLHGVDLQLNRFDDSGLKLECKLEKFQLDDLAPQAPFPVCFTPVQFKLVDGNAPPAYYYVTMEIGGSQDALVVKQLDVRLGETNIKMSSNFMSKLQQFTGELMQRATAPAEPAQSPASPMPLHILQMDIKPIRFNVTFVNSAGQQAAQADNAPLFPLYSTLVSAFTSVSNAPLKFPAFVLTNETSTVDKMLLTVKVKYMDQVKRQLFKIAGSSDILGSPVQLVGDVSHGVFSFFYEPALALSMGGGERIGAGLTRGSSVMMNSGAGSVLESLAKVTRAVAKTLATTSGDVRFADWIDDQLNLESFHEPINAIEGVSHGVIVLVKSLLDAVVSMFKSPSKLLRHFAGLLLKPSSGFFGLISQISCGVRNTLVADEETDGSAFAFPARLAKPRELKIQPYSPARCAGYKLASLRFKPQLASSQPQHAKLVVSKVCQVERKQGPVTVLTVVNMVLTDTWLVACREIGLDLFCVPVECIESFQVTSPSTALSSMANVLALGKTYTFTCLGAEQLQLEWIEAYKLKTGKSPPAVLRVESSQRQLTLRRAPSSRRSEIDVAGLRLVSARITSYGGEWEDGVTRYCLRVSGEGEHRAEWTVDRRYREFLQFRDRACEFLSVSRRCMHLPPRKAWRRLNLREQEKRVAGLQRFLDFVVKIELLSESEVLREFLCRGANVIVQQ